jgi:hypothetical protein
MPASRVITIVITLSAFDKAAAFGSIRASPGETPHRAECPAAIEELAQAVAAESRLDG